MVEVEHDSRREDGEDGHNEVELQVPPCNRNVEGVCACVCVARIPVSEKGPILVMITVADCQDEVCVCVCCQVCVRVCACVGGARIPMTGKEPISVGR